jgi:glycogen debranching enzyme
MYFPLLMTAGGKPSEVSARLLALNKTWTTQYTRTADYYAHFFDHRLWTETPDPQFDLAIKWAEISIDQAQVKFHDETGLVAGYYSSADSARPGFAWFFGRDTLFSLYAANSYGDFALSRRALEFLLKRQRADGKIMHEFSQTADLVDWSATPYFYASADSTPLLIMTVADYVRSSGDKEFLRAHWAQIKKAWAFIRAHDSDGDGIYENTEGTGWVESWPGGMPHQEIYLAALDHQASRAMVELAIWLDDTGLARKLTIDPQNSRIEREYLRDGFYAFSRNADGSLDRTATAFPSVAWWDNTLDLQHSEKMFERWASHEFSTDWGVRDVSHNEKIYDPMSYHQGSVWPLYTGWMALAEYRAKRPYAGYAHLMQNALMTFTQDQGAVTELLSGEFFQPFGRSSSHQLWSSAMVLTPAIRGLFGINAGLNGIEPQLPAAWESATLHNVPVKGGFTDVHFKKEGAKLIIEATGAPRIELPLPPFEVNVPASLPAPGAPTSFPKILAQSANSFDIEGIGGTTAEIDVRFIKPPTHITGATLAGKKLTVHFPPGEGYQRTSIQFTW